MEPAPLDYEIAAPEPAGLVASLGALGYSLSDAVADLVDNSISAAASRLDVDFTWAGTDSWIAVSDDGHGMSADELVTAMTVAARWSADRATRDLGRFGMGLKSASFSQSGLFTVVSRRADTDWQVRTWDRRLIEVTGEWRLLHYCPPSAVPIVERLLEHLDYGTVVVWQRLRGYEDVDAENRRAQISFHDGADRVARHLGVTFARYVEDRRLTLSVNGEAVTPWDPFLLEHPSTISQPPEELPLAGHLVGIRPYVLPSLHRLAEAEAAKAGGVRGWQRQQGFYVYRRDRLISAGGWLGLRGLRTEERFNLARIAIDIPAETDAMWQVDVRKASVTAPVLLRPSLLRIATNARKAAAESVRFRGQLASREHDTGLHFAWNIKRKAGTISCSINRNHPVIRALLDEFKDDPAQIKAVLRLLEETVPIAGLRALHETDTADDPQPFHTIDATNDSDAVAQQILALMIASGRSRSDALGVLRQMQPFDQIDGFWTEDVPDPSPSDCPVPK